MLVGHAADAHDERRRTLGRIVGIGELGVEEDLVQTVDGVDIAGMEPEQHTRDRLDFRLLDAVLRGREPEERLPRRHQVLLGREYRGRVVETEARRVAPHLIEDEGPLMTYRTYDLCAERETGDKR